MKVTVIGGGNIGALMAADIAYRGHEVTLYISKPELWKTKIMVYNAQDELLRAGVVDKVTNSMKEAMEDAEVLFVTMPAPLFEDLGEKMLPFVQNGQKIGIVPGTGGAEFAFRRLIESGGVLFGLQRVHSIARLKKQGESVYELGRKTSLKLGAIPAQEAAGIGQIVEELLDLPCDVLENYLSVTLTPSNSILHTTRLYALLKGYRPGDTYPCNVLFYEEWSDASSEILLACDRELQELCQVIPLELSSVLSLRDYYESDTAAAMTKKIRSIPAFHGLLSPMKKSRGGFVPDWDSRYFTADFCYGLKVMKDIAKLFAVSTPNMDLVWNWYESTAPAENRRVFELNGTKHSFTKLYRRSVKKNENE